MWAANALIADPVLEGPMQPTDQTRLRASVEEALREQRFDLIAASDVESAISGEPNLKGCHTDQCFERLGRVLDAQLVMRYRVKLAMTAGRKNGDWHMNVELFDVEVGAMGSRLTEDCKDCSIKQASDQLLDMSRRAMLQSASQSRAALEIQSTPAGAAVFVDGTELGITPYKRPAFVGKHKVVLRHLGYRSEQLDANVEESKRNRFDVKLNAGSDPVKVVVVEKEKSPIYKKWWFWVAVGGGAVAVAAITAGVIVGTRSDSTTSGTRMVPSNTLMFNF